MSDTAASLQRKIDSAMELQSVVRVMKALAASSIGQYKKSVLALTDYYRTVELGLGVCLRARELDGPVVHPQPRIGPCSVRAVVFGSDQGLVGRFNDAVQSYNTAIKRFPAVIFAGMFGHAARPYFTAVAGAEKPPTVQFDFGAKPAPAKP